MPRSMISGNAILTRTGTWTEGKRPARFVVREGMLKDSARRLGRWGFSTAKKTTDIKTGGASNRRDDTYYCIDIPTEDIGLCCVMADLLLVPCLG